MQELFDSLTNRLHSFIADGDASVVLADEALAEADRLWRAALASGAGVAVRVDVLTVAASLHRCRFQALPDGEGGLDLRVAVGLFAEVGRADPGLVPEDVCQVLAAGVTTGTEPEAWAEEAGATLDGMAGPIDADRAIGLLRKAVDATRIPHPHRPRYLSSLGVALHLRFQLTGDAADLDAAIDALREAIALAERAYPNWPSYLPTLGLTVYLANLALVLHSRFDLAGNVTDLDNAVTAVTNAIALTSAEHPDRPRFLAQLAAVAEARFWLLGRLADIDDAIAALREAVERTPEDLPDRLDHWSLLGHALTKRFERTGNIADIDDAITELSAATKTAPADHPGRVTALAELGTALTARFHQAGTRPDLDAAIDTFNQAIRAAPDGDPSRAECLAGLGTARAVRFDAAGDPSDLDAAIDLLGQAVQAIPAGDSVRGRRLSNLASTLVRRFQRAGKPADLDAAIDALGEALHAAPPGHSDRPSFLTNLSAALHNRFDLLANLGDLDAAFDAISEALAATPADHPDLPSRLASQGSVLEARFRRTSDRADLENAVTALRAAIDATPAGHTDRPRHLATLGSALHLRFERLGEATDADAAIAAFQEAVSGIADDHPSRVGWLSDIGATLMIRFDQLGNPADLDNAIANLRKAVDAAPADWADRARPLANYGAALHTRFQRSGNPKDLEDAIAAMRTAADATPAGNSALAHRWGNLGNALESRFDLLGDPADLDAAIRLTRQALDIIAADHPERANCLNNLAGVLETRFAERHDPADAQAAFDARREATTVTSASVRTRLRAARAWGEVAAKSRRWPDAADGYETAVRLLPLLAWHGLGRGSRERLTEDSRGLAGDGAACAIATGQPGRALEILEQGRGVLWSQLLETRTDLTALHQAEPRLAARLAALRAELDAPHAMAGNDPSAVVDARMAAAREWDVLIKQIQALPGFRDFARPPDASVLRRAAGHGTVVVINVSRWRCDALLVSANGIRVEPLPNLTMEAAYERTNAYLRALQEFRQSPTALVALEQVITVMLQWLWEAIAEPVLTALGYQETPTGDRPWPRVWWCPTGPLTALPLHAAGFHDEPGDPSVLDRVVSSYTPTLRALAEARARTLSTMDERLLHIALRDTPDQPTLTAVDREKAILAGFFRESQRTLLAGVEATRAGILHHLTRHAWVHASCHGDQDLTEPANGGLVPYDWNTSGRVRVLDVAAGAGGEFAFLSACKTATGGVRNLDEAISFASALHYVGWRHVIGTLWSVWDDAAADITDGVYARLTGARGFDPACAADALHHTLREYRERDDHRYRPSRWAPFLHTGL